MLSSNSYMVKFILLIRLFYFYDYLEEVFILKDNKCSFLYITKKYFTTLKKGDIVNNVISVLFRA